jgi:hypothetical protein
MLHLCISRKNDALRGIRNTREVLVQHGELLDARYASSAISVRVVEQEAKLAQNIASDL